MNDTGPISHVVDYTESIENSAEPHTKGADTMKSITKFVGLDVSKEKIAVAVADEGRGEPRFIGMFPHTVEAVRNLVRQLDGEGVKLEFCYEAGPDWVRIISFVTMRWTCAVQSLLRLSSQLVKEIE